MYSKKIGIWGCGIVGKSVARYLHKHGYQLGMLEKRALSQEEKTLLATCNITLFTEEQKKEFFDGYDCIIPSAGIDLRPYAEHAHKWLSEVDLFFQLYGRPTIAITGTVGKTSVTHLLTALLRQLGASTAMGGNIGSGLLDLLDEDSENAVLELSSFQLELIRHYAPQLAIITNLSENHLDRHGTYHEYFLAKYQILRYQTASHKALLPAELYQQMRAQPEMHARALSFFSNRRPKNITDERYTLYYFNDAGHAVKEHNGSQSIAVLAQSVPELSYPINWLIVYAALDMLGYAIPQHRASHAALPHHRLEYVGRSAHIDFYNDSKSTVPVSTLAALEYLSPKPVILLLGGISKGIDREPFIRQLVGRTVRIHCFGAEAAALHTYAQRNGIASSVHATLEDAFAQAVENANAHDQILFSPAGASYDLYKNFEERGTAFLKLVKALEGHI